MLMSVVIPCYDEAGVVCQLHDALIEQSEPLGVQLEVIYVDDGSTDGTLDLLRKLADQDARVHFLSFSRNFGKESAMLAGLRRASGDAVVLMDADMQHPPALLGRMLELYRAGANQVVARRDRTGEPWLRTLASRGFYKLVNAMVKLPLVDGAGDYRLLSRRAVDALLELGEYNRFSKGLFSWIGFDPVYVPYPNVARAAGRTKWSLRGLLGYAVAGIVSFNDRPLRAAIYVGLPVTLVGVGYMIWVIARAMIYGVSAPGYVTVLTAVIVFGGLQTLLLGVMGEYMGRVYYETKRRPHYIVGETDEDPGRLG